MSKIVLIGAGSHVFSKAAISDILSYPDLTDNTITLVGHVHKEPLDLVTAFARKLVKEHGFNTKIESTTDRREALEGADYVLVAIRVGGSEAAQADREITAKYGINQSAGDTIGPLGVFLGARQIPVMLDICHDMEDLCPDAWLINYTNPMAIICWTLNDYTHVKNVGICNGVLSTSAELAKYIGVPYEEISYWVAGINHMAWFLEFKWRGEDAYPLLREKFKDPAIYSGDTCGIVSPDIVRAEILRAFCYFSTESSPHMSEYVPYFRKRPELIERFKLDYIERFKEERAKMRREQDEEFRQQISSAQKLPISHRDEYGSIMVHSIKTDIPSRINANVKNRGLINNLPEQCCVEVPCLVDKEGIHPCCVGDLPLQLAALNRTNINVQELAVRGIAEKDKTKIFQSILLDPLTSALLTIDETQRMVNELFTTGAKYLKGFK